MAMLFWISVGIIFYTYLGYGFLMYLLVKLKKWIYKTASLPMGFEPEVAIVIPCYNELQVLEEKLKNTFALDYPKSKLSIYFITDGSTDGSETYLKKQDNITVLHIPERMGKAAAENRSVQFIKAQYVIFTDANTYLNKEAVKEMVKHFSDSKVGVVSGEKRILSEAKNAASIAGEGMYWKYESKLKQWDSEFYSAIGAAGELIAFRTDLIEDLEHDTLLDDFMQSMRITLRGYKNVYEPNAYAEESASANVQEEIKRKVRISAGSWQSMMRLVQAFNPFHNFAVFFMFVSHKVFRWVLVPLCLLILIPLTTYLGFTQGGYFMYFAWMQVLFYLMVFVGKYFEEHKVKVKLFFIPYYFAITNWSLCLGFIKFLKGSQQVTWDKAKRMGEVNA